MEIDSAERHKALILSLIGLCPSRDSLDEDSKNASEDPVFDPELVIAHCFKQFKQENFCLPKSRRRIIILPPKKGQMPVPPVLQPQAAPQPTPTFKALEVEDSQEPREDMRTWMSQRLKLRQNLESFGDAKKWLQNKASLTPSEAKVLNRLRRKQQVPLEKPLTVIPFTKATKKKSTRLLHRSVPQLQLPQPPALFAFYSYVRSRKVKIMELFHKVVRAENQISREEFFLALKTFGVPLKYQEVEDVVIYLSSLGKKNTITADVLESTYKKWYLDEQKSTLPATKRNYRSAKVKALCSSPKKQVDVAPEPPKMDLLTVPVVNVEKESRPLTLEEMEDVGKRYRERKRWLKMPQPNIDYSEQCRVVRSGVKQVDDHCLPSTISGEMGELINIARRDTFLVYLQCWRLCESYGLPLTEDILMKALLYPGDKIILQQDEVRPIRQPGGYYLDSKKISRLKMAQPRLPPLEEDAKKLDQLSVRRSPRKFKKIQFKEFEEFVRKMQMKRLDATQQTHPNFFWPGHLLDKLRLYLPTVTTDRSLALFSCVHRQPPIYSYHSNHWWPIRNKNYLTYAYYDACKVYHIN